ncbi:hypothetical protein N0V95_006704 [Ascochyta clinopodiicola]|nr:hypothetical protein N0V95_006704 [Ascochyta clinopodiicola]
MDGIIQRTSVDNLPSSNITKIVLQASTFETDCLIQVLSKINGLKSFAHESGESQLFNNYSAFSPKKITTALIKYAGHSLEHLTMRGEDEETPLYVETGEELLYASLAEFQRLKTLRCSTYLLTSDPQSPRPREALASGMDLVAQSSNEYKEAVKSYRRDAYLSETPETLRRLAFATRLPPTLKALHFEDYPCHTPLAYSALLEFVQKANNVLPRLNQIYLSDWGVEYLGKKGLLDIIALNSWKYKKLPNPFKMGIMQRGHSDSESDFEEETEEEYEI